MDLEPESEILKVSREDKQRKELLDVVLKEIELFNLKQDEDKENADSNEHDNFGISQTFGHPPGVRFFNGEANCVFNQNSIKNELTLSWCSYEDLDLTAVQDIERMVHHEYVVDNVTVRTVLFKTLFKLLFTDQSREYLYSVASVLLELASKANQISALLQIAVETLPLGIKNLGGQINLIYSEDEVARLPENNDQTRVTDKKDFSPVENIRYLINVLQFLIAKETRISKAKLNISNVTLDNLAFLLLTVGQDQLILRSSVLAAIRNLLAFILDLYPSDSLYLEKVQDIVERLARSWDMSSEGFDHHTAYCLACDVMPFSIRGKQLKASFAFCALACCLTPDEVEVLDVVHLSTLSKFCIEHTDNLVNLDFHAYYSVVRLIDAAIDRPLCYERDGKYLKEILGTVTTACKANQNKGEIDWYHKPRLEAMLKEMTSEWNRLLVPLDESVGQKRKLH